MRTRVMNQLQVVPLNEGLRRKKALWWPAGRKEHGIDRAGCHTQGFSQSLRPGEMVRIWKGPVLRLSACSLRSSNRFGIGDA
jgi:hypothetical protein